MKEDILQKDIHINKNNLDSFEIAKFERRIYPAHVNALKKSIMEVGLLRPDFAVWENGKYVIIDGQQRFTAIKELILEGYQQSFKVKLNVYKAKDRKNARKLYFEINRVSKSLTISDILKGYDDEEDTDFFKTLEEQCLHSKDKKKISFVMAMNALKYAMTKNPHSVRRDVIEEWLNGIESWHVERFKKFLGIIIYTFGEDTSLSVYKTVVFRNLFRIYWENFEQMQSKKFDHFLNKIMHDRFIRESCHSQTQEAMITIYEYMTRLANVEPQEGSN